ncbi:DUF4334 domain-containing protein [Cellulomonas shaoxiangyii]|uniref:DUF4334 domain-containing protein n=1 Tax=Cellulomonas shaoxiangyii TaxID=2566013 RepID=A0A4P7SKT0_9CELL|nr:DUF4334 domain-containing protein [Cellulomonas shaoxiangyii]QCB94491.1 DUF4334 domain-containing protein [Cellulomonas shaoxiangyii]TGY86073.1 DUF4334 domain-containing protein [Cellulomonas shaoxiangyii]
MPDSTARLEALQDGADPGAVLDLLDTLEPVGIDGLLGRWAGRGIPTGHPFDGLLEALGWYGKRMDTADVVHPLVFRGARGRLVSITPTLLPVGPALRLAPVVPRAVAARAFALVRPLLTTSRPQARLRTVTYRGVASAAMVYDRLPIIDVFRRVDDDTLLGVMDLRGQPHPYVFVLRRERSAG